MKFSIRDLLKKSLIENINFLCSVKYNVNET